MKQTLVLTSILSATLLSACFGGYIYDQLLDGPYRLIAVDVMEDMRVCRSLSGGGGCAGDSLPDPTVVAAGINARYLVIANRAVPWPPGDRKSDQAVLAFYYISRTPDEADISVRIHPAGPYTRAEFEAEKTRLGLPEFQYRFPELGWTEPQGKRTSTPSS